MKQNIKSAYFAGGCFWGVEYYFEKLEGVKAAISGYMGGHFDNPTYQDICSGLTGHLEVVRVDYDEEQITFKALSTLFFEIHDPTQKNGQGPDIGSQYISAIFYNNQNEKETAQELINILKNKDFDVVTKLISNKNTPFYKAEEYHQDYYFVHNKTPYCHSYEKKF